MKKFYRIVSLALCLVFAIGQTAFANTVESPERIIEIETIDEERGGSYTYVDLGTRTEYGSVEAVNASVSLLTGLIVGTLSCSPVAAKKTAEIVYKFMDLFTDDAYFKYIVHTTEVYLDGEFSHYIIDETVYIYSDSDYRTLIDVVEKTGTSLTPLSVDDGTLEF